MGKASFTDIALWLALAAMWSSSYAVIEMGLGTGDTGWHVEFIPSTSASSKAPSIYADCDGNQDADLLTGSGTLASPTVSPAMLGRSLYAIVAWLPAERSVDSALASILMGASPDDPAACSLAPQRMGAANRPAWMAVLAGVAVRLCRSPRSATCENLAAQLLGHAGNLSRMQSGASLMLHRAVYIRRGGSPDAVLETGWIGRHPLVATLMSSRTNLAATDPDP
jgi:hypothetical protein